VGPIVDVVSSDRFGRRRSWIIAMQLGMAASLFLLQAVGLGAGIGLLTTLIIIHNSFAATQDVAIDALAVSTLQADERGMAGGLTFAGAYLGQAVGGAGALYLVQYVGFTNTLLRRRRDPGRDGVRGVAAARAGHARLAAAGSGLARVGAEINHHISQVWGAFTESCASLVALHLRCCRPAPWHWAWRWPRPWPWTWASMTTR
jgi:MFS family permease